MVRSGILRDRASALALAVAFGGCSGARDGRTGLPPEGEPGVGTSEVASPSQAGFTTLTYNIAGLLEPFSSGNPSTNTSIISCRIRGYDLVNVQEDFNYHAALYDTCDDHPYRSATSGGMGIGSGLNTLSRFPYDDWARIRWNACSGVDCLTPKGFTVARVRLAEGVFVDLYNLHTQAQTTDADLVARRKNVLQLASYIEANSAGNAIIVMGDTNTRYTRDGDNPRELLVRGFTDVWVSKIRAGEIPSLGSAAETACAPSTTSPACEVVDKVLYRDNGFVGLAPTSYLVDNGSFLDSAGKDLSDHWPVRVDWSTSPAGNRRLSDPFGGPHGFSFNDVSLLPANPVVQALTLRTGSRVDAVELALTTGDIFSHGGTGGSAQSLELAAAEYLSSVELCSGKHNGTTRIFYARFSTSSGRTLSGGSPTSDCITLRAPAQWQIVGFHGRSADEIDKLGAIYAPLSGSPPGRRPSFQLVNRASGLCLDIQGARMQPGTAVQQWNCSGGAWQRWTYDPDTGLIRSQQDPRFCLDNGGSFENDSGKGMLIWTCVGNAHQRFTLDADRGVVSLRSDPSRVLDGFGTSPGSAAITWTDWGGANQRWNAAP
jgi:hypothetical protein